jgi:hypothetical protein
MFTNTKLFRALLGGPASGAGELSLSTYGKLPIYKDYLRSNLVGPEAVAMKSWLDRGLARHWDGHEACRALRIEPHVLLLNLPDVGRSVVGYLWGSHDSGALRSFPFSLFATLPESRDAATSVACLLALGTALRELRGVREAIEGLPGVEAFYERARSFKLHLELPPDEETVVQLRREVSGLGEADFARSLYGDEAPHAWPALLQYLGSARRPECAGLIAVRLPASDLLPVAAQAALWAHLVVGSRARRRPALASLFAPSNPGAGIVLLDRRVRPDDVLLLNPGLGDHGGVADLRRLAGPAAEGPVQPLDGARPLAAILDIGEPGPAAPGRGLLSRLRLRPEADGPVPA